MWVREVRPIYADTATRATEKFGGARFPSGRVMMVGGDGDQEDCSDNIC